MGKEITSKDLRKLLIREMVDMVNEDKKLLDTVIERALKKLKANKADA